MGLTKSSIRDRARILLNETVEGFWLNSQLETWVDDSAIDISTKTHCYEVSCLITLLTGVQTYTIADDYLKIISAVYVNKGLKLATPQMEGLQIALQSGKPEFYFDIASKIGFFPVPTVTENATTVAVYYSKVTEDITKIPLKFKTPAVLFVVCMGLIKERQYTKAGQLFQLYTQSLNLDKTEIKAENTENPPPQDHYVLKLSRPRQ